MERQHWVQVMVYCRQASCHYHHLWQAWPRSMSPYAGIIPCMHPDNERWCYSVTPSLIGWALTQNDPCIWHHQATMFQGTNSKVAFLYFLHQDDTAVVKRLTVRSVTRNAVRPPSPPAPWTTHQGSYAARHPTSVECQPERSRWTRVICTGRYWNMTLKTILSSTALLNSPEHEGKNLKTANRVCDVKRTHFKLYLPVY